MLIIENLAMRRFTNNQSQGYDNVSVEERQMAMNYRLIQMVELGAKTAAYKKSKQGGKLAMRDVAEGLGFPTFLVQLRH